jgi:hypothetical protein
MTIGVTASFKKDSLFVLGDPFQPLLGIDGATAAATGGRGRLRRTLPPRLAALFFGPRETGDQNRILLRFYEQQQ